MLMALKMASTVVSKDIEEITAFHVRAKTGLGASIQFDRVFLFPAICEIVSGFNFDPSEEVLEQQRRRY
jgi:hypothetical protein